LIIFNANIITINPSQPYSQSLAIHGDQILTVGSNDRVRSSSISGTQHVDMEGYTIVTGFIETHCHNGYSGLL
jgi:predicted amidohydrolase YtcJ